MRVALFTFVVWVGVVGCGDSEKVNPDARVPLSQMAILGVTMGGSHADVRSALGDPPNTARHDVGDSIVTTWSYPDIVFSFLEDEIYDIQCTGASCVTGAGVKMGARRGDVTKAYGPAAYVRNPSGYVLVYKDPPGHCKLVFSLFNEAVDRIYAQCSKPWDLIERRAPPPQ